MINIDGLSLVDKARVVAHEIIKDSTTPLVLSLKKQIKTLNNIVPYLDSKAHYRLEQGDTLSEPYDILRYKGYDCEDDTLFIGTIARAMGYKVEVRIVSNGTNHIYALIYDNKHGRWITIDPVPKPPSYILNKYHTVVQGEVTNNLNNPIIGVKGFSYNPIGLPDTTWKLALQHPNFTRTELISDIAKSTRLSNLSGFNSTPKSVKIGDNYVPEAGDTLKFYYNTIKELPLSIDEWIRKKIISHKNPQFDIISVTNENDSTLNNSFLQDIENFISSPIVNKHNFIVVEIRIKKNSNLGAFMMAIIAISIVLVAGIGYLTLVKVEKIIDKNPELASSLSLLPYIGLGTLGLVLISKLKSK